MISLKRAVSGYFKRRKLYLRTLSGAGIRDADDFAELYILTRFVKSSRRSRVDKTQVVRNRRTFVVATSPTPDWTHGSHFVLQDAAQNNYAVRTGIEVQTKDGGTVELDVLLVDLKLHNGSTVSSASVSSAAEAKNHGRRISGATATEVVGKAVRVFGYPTPRHQGSPSPSKYCLVAPLGFTSNAAYALSFAQIDCCDFSFALDTYIRTVLTSLAIR